MNQVYNTSNMKNPKNHDFLIFFDYTVNTKQYEIATICFMVILICKSHIRSPFAPITSQFSEKNNSDFLNLKKLMLWN